MSLTNSTRRDHHTERKIKYQFIRNWLARRPCLECGTKQKRRLITKRYGGHFTGLCDQSMATIQERLKEAIALCHGCSKIRTGQRASNDAIKNALLSLQTRTQIAAELHTRQRRITRICNQLFRDGYTCLCGRKLAHVGICRFHPTKPVESNRDIPIVASRTGCTGDRACPYPIFQDGMCRHHHQFYAFSESLTGDSINPADYFPLEMNNFNPLLTVARVSELRHIAA